MKTQQKSINIVLILDGDFYEVPVEFLVITDEMGTPVSNADLLSRDTEGELKDLDIQVKLTIDELQAYKIEEPKNKILN